MSDLIELQKVLDLIDEAIDSKERQKAEAVGSLGKYNLSKEQIETHWLPNTYNGALLALRNIRFEIEVAGGRHGN